MRQNCHSILKWSLLTGTSTILLKLCYETFLRSAITTTNRSASTYENTLTSWASTGKRSIASPTRLVDTKLRDDLQLIGAQIYFRHGARTPLHLLPGIEEISYSKEHIESYPFSKWDIKLITKLGNNVVSRDKISSANDIIGDRVRHLKVEIKPNNEKKTVHFQSSSGDRVVTGQLTALGEKQLYELGKTIRKEIIKEDGSGLIPTVYDPKIVYCRSTFMDRTVASARSFLAGLFSSSEKGDKIQAKGAFEIEVHNFPDEDMFPNSHAYPILKKCLTAVQLYSSLHDDHDLKKARQALIDRIGVSDYSDGILELYDDIVSRQAHNFSIPKDFSELTKDFEVMSAREFVSMATSIGFDVFIRATCGPLLYLMRENFDSIAKNYLENNENKSYQKLFLYSGHDTTLVPLAMALEIFDMRWPKYASHILMKYFISKTNPKETYVAVNYAGEPQILPNCDSYYCPYSTLMGNLQNRFEKPKVINKH
ncbi:unnamed protein product [Adineta ricciae]|uniref:2-phosphoxylose phosphatase 1 n=1 Tax=Adineta ricciae TaxID=249248 RepID=A0A814T954_ADIRI|nr:unnamed protein product [Adineta ricciae]CAF1272993.1 unnamed protein product [Adineta ricciae]